MEKYRAARADRVVWRCLERPGRLGGHGGQSFVDDCKEARAAGVRASEWLQIACVFMSLLGRPMIGGFERA